MARPHSIALPLESLLILIVLANTSSASVTGPQDITQEIQDSAQAENRSPEQAKHEAWQKAQSALKEGYASSAFLLFQDAMAASADEDADLYSNLGICLIKLGYESDAVSAFRKSLRLKPGHKQASANLARLLNDKGMAREAMECLEDASVKSADADIFSELGFLYYMDSQPLRAIGSYEKALSLKPEDPSILYDLACLYSNNGRIEEAKVALQQALKNKNDFADAHFAIGQIYELEGDLTLAKESYMTANALSPKNKNILDRLTRLFIRSSDITQARWALDALIILDPDAKETKYYEAIVLLQEGSYYRAAIVFENLASALPDDAGIWNNLAVAYNRLGDAEKAKEAIKKAVALDPNRAAVYTNIGVLEAREKRWSEAKEAWEKALQLDPKLSSAAVNLDLLKNIKVQSE